MPTQYMHKSCACCGQVRAGLDMLFAGEPDATHVIEVSVSRAEWKVALPKTSACSPRPVCLAMRMHLHRLSPLPPPIAFSQMTFPAASPTAPFQLPLHRPAISLPSTTSLPPFLRASPSRSQKDGEPPQPQPIAERPSAKGIPTCRCSKLDANSGASSGSPSLHCPTTRRSPARAPARRTPTGRWRRPRSVGCRVWFGTAPARPRRPS